MGHIQDSYSVQTEVFHQNAICQMKKSNFPLVSSAFQKLPDILSLILSGLFLKFFP